jgi:hypothetical protein
VNILRIAVSSSKNDKKVAVVAVSLPVRNLSIYVQPACRDAFETSLFLLISETEVNI